MASFGMSFSAHGLSGRVDAAYTVNHDPKHLGYDRLGLDGPEMARGFPVLAADIQYEGAGYFGYMGWVQVVRAVFGDGPEEVIIDRPPSMEGVQQPFVAWGPCPRFFDAPGTTDRPVAWHADTFLTVTPDLLMSKIVQPVCSFQWGYDVSSSGQVQPRPAVQQELDVWQQLVPLLESDCPDWEFLIAT